MPSDEHAWSEVEGAFANYRSWLRANAPDLERVLRPGATNVQLDAFEAHVGRALPASLRALWRQCDGQAVDVTEGIAAGFWFLSIEEAQRQWDRWKALGETTPSIANASSTPDDAIDLAYTNPGWIPVFQEPMEANYVGVDLAPDTTGVHGQVINFGRDEDDKYVLARDLGKVLVWLAKEAVAEHIEVHLPGECERCGEHHDDESASPFVAFRRGARFSDALRDANLSPR